jgi:hypothetical protein
MLSFIRQISGLAAAETLSEAPAQRSIVSPPNGPSRTISAPLLRLSGLARPPHPQNRSDVLNEVGAEVRDAFSTAEKKARRQGWVIPRYYSLQAGANAKEAASHSNPHFAMLDGAIKGMQKMTPINRSHVKMMLLTNDVPGLKAAAEGSQPLRSYATGLKMTKHVLARPGVEQLPPRVRTVLEEMQSLYDSNPQLVSLGDQRAFSEAKPRSEQDVQVLMSTFDKADTLVSQLKSALSDGGMDFSDRALRA